MYVGDNHDSSLVVVIHQHNPWDGQYDEDKVVLGCDSIEEAIGLYKSQYDRPGFYREGQHTAMPIGAFWRWINEERNMGKRVKMARRAASTSVLTPEEQREREEATKRSKGLNPFIYVPFGKPENGFEVGLYVPGKA